MVLAIFSSGKLEKKEKGYKICPGLGLVGNLSGIVLVWDERRLTKNPLRLRSNELAE
jgi:hypothetical protein